jgi:hypothetical protein
MAAMRNTGLSVEHRKILNTRVINTYSIHPTTGEAHVVEIPDPCSVQFAVYVNKVQDDVNQQVFYKYLQDNHGMASSDPSTIPTTGIAIKAGAKWKNDSKPLNFGERHTHFQACVESDVTADSGKSRCDPFLRLHTGCSLMVNLNEDVKHGIANGTTCIFDKVLLMPNALLQPIQLNGFWIFAVNASEVKCFQLTWKGSGMFTGRFA